MKDIKEIEDFEKELYRLYQLPSITTLFYHKSISETKISEKQGYIVSKVKELSAIFGMNEEDVAETNYEAARKIYDKYPFFELFSRFQSCYQFVNNDKEFFNKYSEKNILERLKNRLIESDRFFPGTYHPNAEITEIEYQDVSLFDFPDYKKMMESFFDMYDRLGSLLSVAIKTDLNRDEINEYNILVSWFGLGKRTNHIYLYYDILKNECNDLYALNNHFDFKSYVRIENSWVYNSFKPWRCKQFAENKEYAQKFEDIYPLAKKFIFGDYMLLKNIHCTFVWSDASFYEFDTFDNEQECSDIYIPKTCEEIGEDAKYAELLSKMILPENKGGLIVKTSKTEKTEESK